MKNLVITTLALLALLLLGACGSKNAGTGLGTIGGSIDIVGPINGAAELTVGLFPLGSDIPVQTAIAGRVSSVATATLAGRAIAFSFTDVEFGSYTVELYNDAATDTMYYASAAQVLSEATPSISNFDAEASFSGAGPFGSISGVALLSDDFAFPPVGELAFIGFSPVSDPPNALQHIVSSADASGNQLVFNVDGLAYGTWLVGLYGYNPVTHAVSTFGLLDDPVTVNATNLNITGAVFGADSDGDPGADPTLGTISGAITFNGALPAGGYYAVAANTIPPQQGAPPSSLEIVPADVVGGVATFTLPLLPDGEYSVSIFSYDFATHQATYFGEYDGTVTIDSGNQNVADIDFSADVNAI